MDTDTAATSQERVPASWPGAFKLYKYSRQAMQVNLMTWVLIGLIGFIVSLVLQMILKGFGSFVANVLGVLFTTATTIVYLADVKGQKLDVQKAFSEAFSFWLKMFILDLFIGLSILVSFLLLIIPFFFVLPRLVLAPYYLIDKKLSPSDAYKASWHGTKGHSGKVWGIIGVTFLMFLPIVTIIGIPLAIYWLIMYSAAFAVLYTVLTTSSAAASPVQGTPVAPPVANTPVAPAPPTAAAPTNPVS